MRFLKLLIIFTLLLLPLSTMVMAEEPGSISIIADGVKLLCDVPPIITNGRTLVPIRTISEHNEADVTWVSSTKTAKITTDDISIRLQIDNAEATLNGKTVTLEAPATIIQDRTMVPVRFVAEAFGYKVDWDDTTRSVLLTSPEKPEEDDEEAGSGKARLNTIGYANSERGYRVTIKFNSRISGDYSIFELDDPKRIIVDIENADIDYTKRFEFDNETVVAARAGNHDEFLRVVIDLKEDADYEVFLSNKKDAIILFFDVDLSGKPTPDEDIPEEDDEDIEVPEIDGNYTVVIDPGHGGNDPGALGKEDGKTVVEEDDVNLETALYLKDILEEAGIDVVMTRKTSKKVTLSERCKISNEAEADLFISIHSNSVEVGKESANGTMVFYGAEKDSETDGILSEDLAEHILDYLCDALETKNLGTQNGDELAVIRGTDAPAVLVELAFISNPGDREKLMDSEYLEKAAYAIAEGIFDILE